MNLLKNYAQPVERQEWGDFTILYLASPPEVLCYELDGVQMNAADLDKAGFQPPDDTVLLWALQNDELESRLP